VLYLRHLQYYVEDLYRMIEWGELINRTGGVMVSVFASSVVDRVFESQSGQIKDYKIGICSNFAKHIALRRKRTKHLFIPEPKV
jgi:hypothetical protein